MSANISSANPVVQAIISGKAPPAARMAAARGLLPLPQADLLEVLIALRKSDAEDVAQAAERTLQSQETESLLSVATAPETSPAVLSYIANFQNAGRAAHEAVTLNPNTPYAAIASLAAATTDGSLLEVIVINQQRLIQAPEIIEAIIGNAARTPEAERRARETKREFFEKERGAQQIAEELKVRGKSAAAEFIEAAESIGTADGLEIDDLWIIADHIEVSDAEIDDSWVPYELIETFYTETSEQRAAHAEYLINEVYSEMSEGMEERISLIRKIARMTVKDRMKLAMKGDKEARLILIRDSNKVVCTAVVNNPRITEQEVEKIAAMSSVSDEVLRVISMNRAWARLYSVTHNLARNPRTPIAIAMNILIRLQDRDLQALSMNRNVSETVRRQANRVSQQRSLAKNSRH